MNSARIGFGALLLISTPLQAAQVDYYRLVCHFPTDEQQWIVAYDRETSELMFTGSNGAPSYSGRATNPEYLRVSRTTAQSDLQSLVLHRFTLTMERLTTGENGEVAKSDSAQCTLDRRQI